MAYLFSGASQIHARQYRHSGIKALPNGTVATRASNLEMQPLWYSGINHRISKHQLNLWTIARVKKKQMVKKIVAKLKGEGEKPISTNPPRSKYDVFVNFRGDDIRQGFLGHLINAFARKKINAFVDDKLKRGDDISHSLDEAIKGSSISLVIFSKNYADSRWCLEELETITKCKEKYGQIVIPVFFGVDPSDVRRQKKSYEDGLVVLKKKQMNSYERELAELKEKQKNSYERRFAELEEKLDIDMSAWKIALTKSANLSGIELSNFRNEADLLENIISVLLKNLGKQRPLNSKVLIGVDKPIAHLKSLLKKESQKATVIGIWGMGGIGKTTIAKELFDQICSEYDGCCFLEKVSEKLKKQEIQSLKEKIFSDILEEDVKIDPRNWLPDNVEGRISRMKVLIVLDNVKDTNQLRELFGTTGWFRPDSRIIVTSRDKQVLVANGVDDDDIHEVEKLSTDDAFDHFNLYAFKPNSQLKMEECCELSKSFVNYAGGIPLVLEKLGLLLLQKDKEIWVSMLDQLKREPIKEVYDVLILSYEDLRRLEKKTFLDIACFFNGLNMKMDYMKLLLKEEESDSSVAVRLVRLTDYGLVDISEDNVVSMHEIIQEMGREIVRQESTKNPGICIRLFDTNDICDVLKNDKGTDAIRSISADLSAIKKLKLSPHVFAKMTNLKFLDFHGEYDLDVIDFLNFLPQGLQSFPTDLRYIHWMHYPLHSLPDKFSAENLVVLDLSFGRVVKLWCGVQNMVSLKQVNLSRSELLRELPDFSKATNLEVLDVSCCHQLNSVHPSIFLIKKLEKINLSLCLCLTEFTSNVPLSSLRYLNLGFCNNLSKLSVKADNLIELNLAGIYIDAWPTSFGCQSKLEILNFDSSDIDSIHSWINNLTRLRQLNLRFCKKLQALPEIPSSVETQLVEGCSSLKTILFPSTAADQFKENRKRVEFWNCINLDEVSLKNIELNAQINLMRLMHQHATEHDHVDYKDNYASYRAFYAYPGSSVPEWLEYKTTKHDMIIDLSTAKLYPLLGFIFCFILSEGTEYCDQIELGITVIDSEGDGEKEDVCIYMTRSFFYMESDHVCMIYDPPSSRHLTSLAKNQTRFKIEVTARSCDGPEVWVKGFGVSPINTSEYHNFIQKMELFDLHTSL